MASYPGYEDAQTKLRELIIPNDVIFAACFSRVDDPLSDLRHCIPLELLAEITRTLHRLLASNSGKKTSTNLGAIHTC